MRKKKGFEDLTAQAVYGYLRSCRITELQIGREKRLKLTTPDDKQIDLTALPADKELLDEDRLQIYR